MFNFFQLSVYGLVVAGYWLVCFRLLCYKVLA